jgi:hypothetical protein
LFVDNHTKLECLSDVGKKEAVRGDASLSVVDGFLGDMLSIVAPTHLTGMHVAEYIRYIL